MTGLAEVLRQHRLLWDDELAEWVCGESGSICGWHRRVPRECRDESANAHAAHVAAAVTAWLAERLASEDVREAVETAITNAWHSGDSDVTAALAAVVGALVGEGNADSAPEAAKTAPVSDRGPESGQGDHRDDEGRSGARDGSGS